MKELVNQQNNLYSNKITINNYKNLEKIIRLDAFNQSMVKYKQFNEKAKNTKRKLKKKN
jgi:hypothetical protein